MSENHIYGESEEREATSGKEEKWNDTSQQEEKLLVFLARASRVPRVCLPAHCLPFIGKWVRQKS